MRTIFSFGALGVYLIFSLSCLLKWKVMALVGRPEAERQAYVHKVAAIWGRFMVKSTFSKVEIKGLENIPEGNVLYVGNHQGYMDIALLLGYLPKGKGFVAKIEMAKAPIMSGWMKRMGSIFLNRSDLRQSVEAIKTGIEKLKNGETLVIFPEGHRSKGGPMEEFKKGSLQLAVKSGVPVVPVTIDGSYQAYEEHHRIRPAKVLITIHPAIYMDSLTPEEKKGIAEIVENQVRSALV